MGRLCKQLIALRFIGPIFYALIISILAIIEPNYNPVTQSMSELGAIDAQYAILTNIFGYPLLGLFLICFVIGMHYQLPSGRAPLLSPILNILSGVSLILTGVFRCDPGCVDLTINGNLHSLFASLAELFMIIVPIAIIPRIYKEQDWCNYIWIGWAIMLLTSTLSLLYIFPFSENLTRLLQRLSMGVPLFWVVVLSIKLLRLDR